MTRAVAVLLVVAWLATAGVADARGPRGSHGGFFGRPAHGHPINAWLGSRRLRLR